MIGSSCSKHIRKNTYVRVVGDKNINTVLKKRSRVVEEQSEDEPRSKRQKIV